MKAIISKILEIIFTLRKHRKSFYFERSFSKTCFQHQVNLNGIKSLFGVIGTKNSKGRFIIVFELKLNLIKIF